MELTKEPQETATAEVPMTERRSEYREILSERVVRISSSDGGEQANERFTENGAQYFLDVRSQGCRLETH